MTLPDGDWCRITLGFSGPAVPNGAACVLACQDLTHGPLSDIAGTVIANFAAVVGNLTTSVSWDSVLIKRGPDESGPSAEYSVAVTGGSGGNAVPPNTSVLFFKNTAYGGRKYKGRMYLPGFREDGVDSAGVIDGGYVTNFQTDIDAFVDNMLISDFPLVLEHGPDSGIANPTPILNMSVSSTVATQRRRLRR